MGTPEPLLILTPIRQTRSLPLQDNGCLRARLVRHAVNSFFTCLLNKQRSGNIFAEVRTQLHCDLNKEHSYMVIFHKV